MDVKTWGFNSRYLPVEEKKGRADLIILDDSIKTDELEWLINFPEKVFGLTRTIYFESGFEVLEYLKSKENNNLLPIGALFDMRIIGENKITENIVRYLRRRNANLSNYSYLTGNFSQDLANDDCDANVIKRTPLYCIEGKYIHHLEPFFEKLARKKLSLIPEGKIGQREPGDLLLYRYFQQFHI